MAVQMRRHWRHRRRWSRCVRRSTRRWTSTASSSTPTSQAASPSCCCDSQLYAASASSAPIISSHRSSSVTCPSSRFYSMLWRIQTRLFSCISVVNRLWISSLDIDRTAVLVCLWLRSHRRWQQGFIFILNLQFGCSVHLISRIVWCCHMMIV